MIEHGGWEARSLWCLVVALLLGVSWCGRAAASDEPGGPTTSSSATPASTRVSPENVGVAPASTPEAASGSDADVSRSAADEAHAVDPPKPEPQTVNVGAAPGGVAACSDGWAEALRRGRAVSVWVKTAFQAHAGVLVTAKHVATHVSLAALDYAPIEVELAEGRVLSGQVIYADTSTGLTILELDGFATDAPLAAGDEASLPPLTALVAVGQPLSAVAAGPDQLALRGAPSFAHLGNLQPDGVFTVNISDNLVVGAPLVGCDGRLYGMPLRAISEGTALAVDAKALLAAVDRGQAEPFSGSAVQFGSTARFGLRAGPSARFGAWAGFDLVYLRRAYLATAFGTSFGKAPGGESVDFTLGYRWTRYPLRLEGELGAGYESRELDIDGKPCSSERCVVDRAEGRPYLLGRVGLVAAVGYVGYTLRMNPSRHDFGHVVSVGLYLSSR